MPASNLFSVQAAMQALAAEDALFLDTRYDLTDAEFGPRAFADARIPGAMFFNQGTDLVGPCTGFNGRHPLPARADFILLLEHLGLQPEQQLIVYDDSGGQFATRLWWMLRWAGFERVAVLDGGWQAWQQAQAPIDRQPADAHRVAQALADLSKSGEGTQQSAAAQQSVITQQSVAEKQSGTTQQSAITRQLGTTQQSATMQQGGLPLCTREQILAHYEVGASPLCIIDARSAERYRGEVEPLDPVAGHIPGALNRPTALNLQADGRFKPAEQLLGEFEALISGYTPQQVVHQCGSGITACHNLFAMEYVGLTGSALYAGSWSEWVAYDDAPIAVGPKP